jgi:hypothetical protein
MYSVMLFDSTLLTVAARKNAKLSLDLTMIGFQQLKYDIYNATTECFVLDTASYTKRLHRDLPCALMPRPSRPSPNDLRCTVPQFDSRGSRRAPTPPRLTLTPSAPRTPLPVRPHTHPARRSLLLHHAPALFLQCPCMNTRYPRTSTTRAPELA